MQVILLMLWLLAFALMLDLFKTIIKCDIFNTSPTRFSQKGRKMKTAAIFLGGLVAGWLLLWQVQSSANALEEQCVKRQTVTGYNCKKEVAFSEFVYNVK